MKQLIVLLIVPLLVACSRAPESKYSVDKCVQIQQFEKCLKSISLAEDAGKAVRACEDASSSLAIKPRALIAEECRTY